MECTYVLFDWFIFVLLVHTYEVRTTNFKCSSTYFFACLRCWSTCFLRMFMSSSTDIVIKILYVLFYTSTYFYIVLLRDIALFFYVIFEHTYGVIIRAFWTYLRILLMFIYVLLHCSSTYFLGRRQTKNCLSTHFCIALLRDF